MSKAFELTGQSRAVQEAGLLYVKITKEVVRYGKYNHRKIYVTGGLYESIRMLQNVKQTGNKIGVLVGISQSHLGGHKRKNVKANYAKIVHDGANYKNRSLIARPYFEWAWEGGADEINIVIMSAIDVKVNNKWEA